MLNYSNLSIIDNSEHFKNLIWVFKLPFVKFQRIDGDVVVDVVVDVAVDVAWSNPEHT